MGLSGIRWLHSLSGQPTPIEPERASRKLNVTEPDAPPLAALGRSMAVARHDTRPSRGGADVLLARWTTHACGSFGLTDLWAEQPEAPRPAGVEWLRRGSRVPSPPTCWPSWI